jgi:DNA-binding IclR family transcriptional regulator
MTDTQQQTKVDQIIGWLNTHPGTHSPRQIATGTGIEPSRCASLLIYLAKDDRVERYKNQSIPSGPGSSLYGAPK